MDPILAVTCGDPAGIGPEVAVQAARSRAATAGVRCLLVGPAAVWRRAGAPVGWPVLCTPDQIHEERRPVAVFDLPWVGKLPATGRGTRASGRLAFAALERAVDLVLAGEVAGLVTAPLSKEAVAQSRPGFTGHTEYLEARVRELRPAARAIMVLEGGGLRVALATTHLPLKAVARAIEKLGRVGIAGLIRQLGGQLRLRYGVDRPRIGVLGLNPHAGEGGLLGDEEQRIIGPAIVQARSPLWEVSGPLPGDTAPYQMKQGRFDVLLAMHHDQGLGPLKLAGFVEGINVTLGLDLVRTSPDHGTAFDIAGKNVADPRSMLAAVRRAAAWVR